MVAASQWSVKLAATSLLLLILVLGASRECAGLRILGIFPLHGKSHFVMCEALMRGLAARGHQVDVYSHFPLKKPPPNYRDFSIASPTIPSIHNNMSYEFFTTFSERVSMYELQKLGGQPICELMDLPVFQKLLKQTATDSRYDLVIVELFLANCYLAWGRYLDVPMVTVMTTTIFDWLNYPIGNPTNLAVEPSVFARSIAPMNFFQRLGNVLLSNYIQYSFNYYAREQDASVRKYFGDGYPNVLDLAKDIDLMLVNYHHALNGIRPYSPVVVPVAGLHITDTGDDLPKEVQKFLNESSAGFLYFSFGSMVRIETFPKPILDAFYASFKNIAPVRVLIKIAKPEELPPGLPANVMTQSWLSQVKVLKHKNIKAFITHGGLMGTQESIYHGVPMIGIPLFGDQHFNIESYTKRNMAITLDRTELTEEVFTKAIKEIINNPIYKKSAEKVGSAFRDVPMPAMETAVYWTEYIARHGKNTLRSSIVDMPWWQRNLLDVYGFIIFVVLIVLYIIKIIVKKLIGAFNPVRSQQSYSKLKKN